ncbi:helix-turn-helix domain-containing protein [Seleniivibrio woodruffii]|uniref:Regulatory LuxR family protein n=1 Tax=Seleniivibrio woodruffii TaxID=1078050 RepID=A0A4R1K5M3_9BACT|nr:helix-turn-helix transcriptional regulator [Seleniivibrio woodruffii]TCK59496.1 regulatory LuxR family protein [Seleniivibrio woodruffii]TVZ35463.1 regulatory LuxR family protein [Seleniivibrio woodruffii]
MFNSRVVSVAGFSLVFSYLLSFLFEGRVLYSVMEYHGAYEGRYVIIAIIAHFAGLVSCGFFVRSLNQAKRTVLAGMAVCFIITVPFFFPPNFLWIAALAAGGYASGCAVAAWGYFLKAFTPANRRIKTCADVLIFSNLLMIIINITAVQVSHYAGLVLSLIFVGSGMLLIRRLPAEQVLSEKRPAPVWDTRKPMVVLFLFVFIITINSGLMYQVMNPAFGHLSSLTSWYWSVPYIGALLIMRNLPDRVKRFVVLYIGMGLIILSFILFMVLGRGVADYLAVNTLMLGACGIFDLFWWSIIGEMMEHTENPAKTFGINLSANVLGILTGGAAGMAITSAEFPDSEVAVIALSVVCVTLAMLPLVNTVLVRRLRNHAYLMDETADETPVITPPEPLTAREQEVLPLILSGKSNKAIADSLFISESTVKSHVRNIFSKFGVATRAELISILLSNRQK